MFWYLLFVDLIIPVSMIIIGRMMLKRPPDKINSVLGYRTTRSMRNEHTWKFAHEYCGKLWWRLGWIIMLPSLIAHIPLYGLPVNTMGIVSGIIVMVQLLFMIVTLVPTERALKKEFTDEGIRRKKASS